MIDSPTLDNFKMAKKIGISDEAAAMLCIAESLGQLAANVAALDDMTIHLSPPRDGFKVDISSPEGQSPIGVRLAFDEVLKIRKDGDT